MKGKIVRWVSTVATPLAMACGDTGRGEVSVPVFAQGTKAHVIKLDGARIVLTKAEVAFGPLYLCATESAEAESCETALGELLSTHACDALSSEPQPLGSLDGTTGKVRSGFFDYGITWRLTQQAPEPNEGAVDGHSARFVGRIELDDGPTLPFRTDIDLEPLSAGDAAVNGLVTRHSLRDDTRLLTVCFGPHLWFKRVKVAGILALVPSANGEVSFEPGTQPYEAIVQGMTANDPPTLRWEDEGAP